MAWSVAGRVFGGVEVAIVCTTFLYLKFLVSLGIQGMKKFKSGTRAPEDQSMIKGVKKQVSARERSFVILKMSLEHFNYLYRFMKAQMNCLIELMTSLTHFIVSPNHSPFRLPSLRTTNTQKLLRVTCDGGGLS